MRLSRILFWGDVLKKTDKKEEKNKPMKPVETGNIRLDPEKRLSPSFDAATIAKFPVGEPDDMGYRVVDNFCEEHIM